MEYPQPVAISDDGRYLATATDEDQLPLAIWSTETGELLHRVAIPGNVRDLDFSPSGNYLAAASVISIEPTQGEISVWNVENGKSERLPETAAPFWLSYGAGDVGTPPAILFDSFDELHAWIPGEPSAHERRVSQDEIDLLLHPDSSRLATVISFSNDDLAAITLPGRIEVWDLDKRELVTSINTRDPRKPIFMDPAMPQGQPAGPTDPGEDSLPPALIMFFERDDGHISRLSYIESEQLDSELTRAYALHQQQADAGRIARADIDASGSRLALAMDDGTALLFNLRDGESRFFVRLRHDEFLRAAEANDLGRMQEYRQMGAINATRGDGSTPLHLAAGHDNLEMAEWLLDNGARTNVPDRYGKTALFAAIRNSSLEILSRLIASGSNPNAIDGDGVSAMAYAASLPGGRSAEIIDLLHGAGAEISEGALRAAVESESNSILVKLLDWADPSMDLWASFFRAVQKGNPEAILLLLERGADPNAADRYGNTALTESARAGVPGIVGLLLGAGARADNPRAWNPLNSALDTYRPESVVEVVRMLLEAGANPSSTGRNDTTPLERARDGNVDPEASRLLLEWAESTERSSE